MKGFGNLGALAAITALALQGCAVGFGKPYEVTFQNSSSVTITYDPLLAGLGTVGAVAQDYCGKMGKDAVPQMTAGAPAARSVTFDCRVRQGALQ